MPAWADLDKQRLPFGQEVQLFLRRFHRVIRRLLQLCSTGAPREGRARVDLQPDAGSSILILKKGEIDRCLPLELC